VRWALPLLFVLLPLQWVVVPVPALGRLPLHLVALLAFTLAIFAVSTLPAFRPVLRLAAAFVTANVVLNLIWFATSVYHGQSSRDAVEQMIAVFTFLAVASVVCRGARRPQSRILVWARWAALACIASVTIALAVSTVSSGINPVAVLGRTATQADPAVLREELFQPAFAAFGLDTELARAQLRHEIFGAVLTAIFLSVAATHVHPFRSRSAQALYRASIAVSTLFIVMSLSRAVILALASWPLLALWRSLRSGQLSVRQLVLTVVTGLAAAGLAVTGLLSVLWIRFTTDTSSYAARDALLSDALAAIGDHWLTGGVNTVGTSSHNLILDSWLRAGVFAAAAALVVVGLLAVLWLTLAGRLHVEAAWVLPITAALTLPLIRAFTVGGGSLPPGQWVCLGIVAGFLAFRIESGTTVRREAATPKEDTQNTPPRSRRALGQGNGVKAIP